jgi:hypothetical protein
MKKIIRDYESITETLEFNGDTKKSREYKESLGVEQD